MTKVRCSAEFRPGDEQLFVSQELEDFISGIPSGALLSPVIVDKGNQRDPWPVLVGLRATWEEGR